MLTQLGAAMAGIIDSVMVGHYGTTELAAVSFANAIFFTLMVFAMGSLMGITPLIGYAFVQGDKERVTTIFRSGLVYTILLSVAMMLLLLAILLVMPYMGQDPTVLRACVPYYMLAMISTLPFLLGVLEKQFLEGLGNTMVAMVVSITLNVVNIPLNWIFIFGHCGCPALGATGAGVATLIIRILQPIVLYVIIARRDEWKGYLLRMKTTWTQVLEVIKIGLPIGLQQTMEIVAFTGSVVFVGWISKEAVAAHQIANHLSDLFFMVSMGIGAATVIRVSHQYGAGKIHDMHMAADAAMHMGVLWSLVAATICLTCSRIIPMAFTEDEQVIEIASPLLILCGLFQISDALQCVGGARLRGLADVKVPMVIAFVTYIIITIPLGYILMFKANMGVNGMWVAFIVGLTIAAISMYIRWKQIAPKDVENQNVITRDVTNK